MGSIIAKIIKKVINEHIIRTFLLSFLFGFFSLKELPLLLLSKTDEFSINPPYDLKNL